MMVNVANYLCVKGYNVTILLAQGEGEYINMLDSNIKVHSFGSNNRLKLLLFLVKFLKSNKFDTLFTAVPHFNIIAIIARMMAGVRTKIIISERSNTFEEFNKTPFSAYKISILLIPIFYRFADSIVAVSKGVAEDLSKFAIIPLKKITVIYNPAFNNQMLHEAQESVDEPWLVNKEIPVIIGVGRLREQKDFGSLITAIQILSTKRPIRLIIIGDGPKKRELEEQIFSNNLQDTVKLAGFQAKPVSWINKADVFALSSKWEGFGNIIVEALAAGTTIVSTNCKSGPSEILNNGEYGTLTPVADPRALAEAIECALRNPIPSNKLINRAKEFDVNLVMHHYEKILTEKTYYAKEIA